MCFFFPLQYQSINLGWFLIICMLANFYSKFQQMAISKKNVYNWWSVCSPLSLCHFIQNYSLPFGEPSCLTNSCTLLQKIIECNAIKYSVHYLIFNNGHIQYYVFRELLNNITYFMSTSKCADRRYNRKLISLTKALLQCISGGNTAGLLSHCLTLWLHNISYQVVDYSTNTNNLWLCICFPKGHAFSRWFLYRDFLARKSDSLYTVRVHSLLSSR